MRRLLRPEYTDLCVVVGPNLRWTEEDFRDLWAVRPEVLLGYRIALETVSTLREGAMRGRRPSKIVVLDGVQREPGWHDAWVEVKTAEALGAKVEYWEVHRCGRLVEYSVLPVTYIHAERLA